MDNTACNQPWPGTTTIIPQNPQIQLVPTPPVWDIYPTREKDVIQIKLESENVLILELTKILITIPDEKSRELVQQRITEAEARKMALILSNP